MKPASRGLERLDKAIAARVVRRLRWLAENLESINPEPLKGRLRGLCGKVTIESLMKYFAANA